MKWMIASDIHGSAYFGAKLADRFEKEGAQRLILLGDLLYHGPRNDLPEGYAPKELIPILNGLKDRIFCVRGNCDSEVDQMVYAAAEKGKLFSVWPYPHPRDERKRWVSVFESGFGIHSERRK